MPASPSLSRILLLGLLMAVVLVKPVLAMTCEIHDAQRVLASGSEAVMTAVQDSAVDECCALPACNDCCTHATALLSTLATPSPAVIATSALPSLSVGFEPIALPVAIRPPITA